MKELSTHLTDETALTKLFNQSDVDKNFDLIKQLFEEAFRTKHINFFKFAVNTNEIQKAIFALSLIEDKRAITLLFKVYTKLQENDNACFTRGLAAQLASAQNAQNLEFAIDLFSTDVHAKQILIYWVEETILRGKSLSNSKLAVNLYNESRPNKESIKLPSWLLPIEQEQPTLCATYNLDGSSGWKKGHRINLREDINEPAKSTEIVPIKIECFDRVAHIIAASRSDIIDDYYEVEGREFCLTSPFLGSDEDLLRSLPLVCLCYNELTEKIELTKGKTVPLGIVKISYQEAFNNLMALASNGGANSGGHFGAIGRPLAWKSLKGLVGTTSFNPEQIENDAKDCEFISFVGVGDYFFNVFNDVGIMCIRKDRLSVAVFAYSDCD